MADTVTKDRKTQITEAAQNMFREKGYSATSMRDLAARIGIEPASLYSHIRSKEEILHTICFRIAEEFFKSIKDVTTSTESADIKLEKAIVSHVEVIKNNADAFAVFYNDWRHLSEPVLSEFISARREYENIFRGIIQEGLEDGIFKPMDVKFTVLTLFSSLNWLYHWFKPSGKMNPKEIGGNLSNMILYGMMNK